MYALKFVAQDDLWVNCIIRNKPQDAELVVLRLLDHIRDMMTTAVADCVQTPTFSPLNLSDIVFPRFLNRMSYIGMLLDQLQQLHCCLECQSN